MSQKKNKIFMGHFSNSCSFSDMNTVNLFNICTKVSSENTCDASSIDYFVMSFLYLSIILFMPFLFFVLQISEVILSSPASELFEHTESEKTCFLTVSILHIDSSNNFLIFCHHLSALRPEN